MADWNTVNGVCCKPWLVLPAVYSDALSYGDQIAQFCSALNKMIQNNNNLPAYVQQMIQEYISGGVIGEIVQEVISEFILNVKYPPEGLTPATGDGTADDTEAIQGCIDYAQEHNGMAVYFPSGAYSVQSLTLKSEVSLFGFDRYSTKLVLRGGATNPLISLNGSDVGIYNLTLDGNAGVQVENVNVISMIARDVLLDNLILQNGYQLLVYNGTGGHLQVNDVVFGNAVYRAAGISGNSVVQAKGVKFNQLSAVSGVDVLNVASDGGTYDFISNVSCETCLSVSGNDNYFTGLVSGATNSYIDSGMRNTIDFKCNTKKEYYAGEADSTIEGDVGFTTNGAYSENISGAYTSVRNSTESKIVTGVSTEQYKSNKTESITGKKSISAQNMDITLNNPAVYNQMEIEQPYPYAKVSNGDSVINLLGFTGDSENAMPFLDVSKMGITEELTDISSALNSIIETYGSNYIIVIPRGQYHATGTITLNVTNIQFYCFGEIISSASPAIIHNRVNGTVYLYRLTGTNVTNSIGFLVGGNTMPVAQGNSNYTLPYISNFDTCLKLEGSSGYGVQNNNFFLTRMDYFKTAIVLSTDDNGVSWVNENRFYNGWCFGYEGNSGNEVGVKFIKGANQTDPFNGNRFIYFSCEGCATMFDLAFAERNSFINFRGVEQAGNKQILLSSDCQYNHFSSDNAFFKDDMIVDNGLYNQYDLVVVNDSNNPIGNHFSSYFGVLVAQHTSTLIGASCSYWFNANGNVPAGNILRYLTIVNTGSTAINVILPLTVNYPGVTNTFIVEIGALTTGITIQLYGGQVFANSTDATGIIGYQLKAYTKYFVTVTGVMEYKVVEVTNA